MSVAKSVILGVFVLVSSVALGMTELYIPGAAHASGVNGANWRSDLQVMNYGPNPVTVNIELMPADTDNSNINWQPPTFTIGPGETVRYLDVLDSLFSYSGGAALRIISDSDTILATSRTYNLIQSAAAGVQAGASFGQWVPAIPFSDAVFNNQEGWLIMLTQTDPATFSGFRTNIGMVNVSSSTIQVALDIYQKSGVKLGTVNGELPPYGFHQWNQPAAPWGPLDDFYVVARPVSGGVRLTKFIAFASVIDNHSTGDPILIPTMRTTPVPAPGTDQLKLVALDPPPGSTLSATTGKVSVTIAYTATGVASIGATLPKDGGGGGREVQAGSGTVTAWATANSPGTSTTVVMEMDDSHFNRVFAIEFPVQYNWIPAPTSGPLKIFPASANIAVGASQVFTASGKAPGGRYVWSVSPGPVQIYPYFDSATTTFTAYSSGTYTLQVWDGISASVGQASITVGNP